MSDTNQVQMGLSDETIETAEKLKYGLDLENKAEVVAMAVNILDKLSDKGLCDREENSVKLSCPAMQIQVDISDG